MPSCPRNDSTAGRVIRGINRLNMDTLTLLPRPSGANVITDNPSLTDLLNTKLVLALSW